MTRFLLLIQIAVATFFSSAGSAKEKPIVVQAQPTRTQWAERIGENINTVIRYPRPSFGQEADDGLVSIIFYADEYGRATSPTLVRPARSKDLNREALRAISRIKTMSPMPEGIVAGQRIRANIIFAKSAESYKEHIKLLRSESSRVAVRSALDKNVLVLNVGSRFAAGAGARSR